MGSYRFLQLLFVVGGDDLGLLKLLFSLFLTHADTSQLVWVKDSYQLNTRAYRLLQLLFAVGGDDLGLLKMLSSLLLAHTDTSRLFRVKDPEQLSTRPLLPLPMAV
jgi:hypothetical protein